MSSGGGGTSRRQEIQLERQRQLEAARLAEEESEVNRRKVVLSNTRKGRSLLIKTSQAGAPDATKKKNLAGTA